MTRWTASGSTTWRARRLANIPFAPAKCPVFYGWPILAFGALGLLMSVPSQTIGISVFTDHLLPVLNLTRSQLSFAYMFGTLGSAWAFPPPVSLLMPLSF